MKVEINKWCPEIATKKGTHIFGPHQKTRHPCTVGAGAGSMHGEGRGRQCGNGDGSDAAHPRHRRFCIVFLFLWVGVPAMRGSNRSQDGTGHSKKKSPLT